LHHIQHAGMVENEVEVGLVARDNKMVDMADLELKIANHLSATKMGQV
jgi:hypothetical protein